MKLKLNTQQATAAATDAPAVASAQTPSTGGGLKLSFKRPSDAATILPTTNLTTPTSAKLKLTTKTPTSAGSVTAASKKRVRAPSLAEPSSSNKKARQSSGGTTIRLPSILPPLRTGSIIKLKTGSSAASTPTTATRLKVKHKGKPPVRPCGVGYDSEASDAEEDPSIEENFILRMQPGPDCDLLRRAIEERKLGIPLSQGGADIHLRFFSRDGRRAALIVERRIYAAVLVDLPCIVESMKSWDRRGWWKSADICQMLLVFDRVKSEDEAKNMALPRALDEQTWQWPDGLTPPMQNVRTRRFRKRVSHRTIEKAEEEVERLIALDERAIEQGGRTECSIIDVNQDDDSMAEDERRDDGEDYPTFDVDDGDAEGDEEDEDADAMAARMAMELGGGLEEDEEGGGMLPSDPTQESTETGTPLGEMNNPSPATLAANGSNEEAVIAESDESGDEDVSLNGNDDNDEEGEDEDEREQAQYMVQQREEIEHLEREVQLAKEQLSKTTNPFLKQKVMNKIKSLEGDVEVKRRGLGVDDA